MYRGLLSREGGGARSRAGLLIGLVAVVLGCLFGVPRAGAVPSTAIRYVYTPDSQLSAVVKPEAEAALYSWDAAGNLSSVTRKSSTKLSIIQLEPSKGAVGETVNIWGTGFSTTASNDTVKFHGVAATVTAATAYTLAVKVPSGATTGTVTVQTTTEGPVTSAQTFTVASAVGAPTITSISSSLAAAGTTITMAGTNFETTASNDVVKVNQTDAELVSETSTSVKFVVPAVASGGHVSITTLQGSATGPVLYVPPPGYTTSEVASTSTLTLGSASTVSVGTVKKVGLAVVEGKVGEELSVLLASSTFTQAWISVYSPQNSLLPGEKVFNSGEELLYEQPTLPSTGAYTILIKPIGEATGSVKLTPYAAADVTGTLAPTTSGVSEVVSLPTPGQIATYSVSGTAGEEVSLKMSETTFGGTYRLEWLSPEGTMLSALNASGNGFMASVKFATTGTYKLVVNPVGTVTGSTKLTAYSDVTASITPSTGGESKNLTTVGPGQDGDVTFSGAEGQMVSFVLSELTISEVWVTIYAPSGEAVYLTHAFSSGSEPFTGAVTLPATGTYTMVISPQNEYTGGVKVTGYTFVNVTGSLSPTTGGASEVVNLPTPGQIATYSVSGTEGEEVSVKTAETTFTGTYKLEWLNPEGKHVTTYFGSGNGFMDSVKFPTTGTYKLLVEPQGKVTGKTKLTAYNSTAVTTSITPTSGGESKTVTMNVPGQNGFVTFSGTESEEVSFVLSELAIGDLWVTIYKPGGETLYVTHAFLEGEKPAIGPLTLPATGTYTIELNPHEESTGSVKVTAYIGPPPPHGFFVKGRPVSAGSATISGTTPSGTLPGSIATATHALATAGILARTPTLASSASAAPRSRAQTKRRSRGHRGVQGTLGRVVSSSVKVAAAERESSRPPALGSFRPVGSGAWYPRAQAGMGPAWTTAQPLSPWSQLAPPPAVSGATALAGQALKLNGLPLAGLHVSVEDTTRAARTDAAGQFVLEGVPAGHDVLVIEGGVIGGRRYGSFEIGVQATAHQETRLDAPIWMTPLDPKGDQRIASPTRGPVSITTPRIPGLEVRLQAGTVIRDAAGRVVRTLNITAVPVDRPPFPLPAFVDVPLYFTVQPGRAYLSKGAQIVYPNYTHLPAGERVEFWNYDSGGRGWYVYGHGSVTANGKQVIPDPGVKVWEFTGSMISGTPTPPSTGSTPGTSSNSGDPVDLGTGLFNYHRTDLVLPDTIPIVIERTYRQGDSNSYSFGTGTTNLYDIRLWSEHNFKEADLVLPDGGKILYKRTSSGEGSKEAEYKANETPGIFFDSTIKWDEAVTGWDLTLTNGTTYVFGELAPLQAIRNKQGQQLTITRSEGQKGNITQITSPHGRWVKFTYDASNRVTEIKDNSGRTLKYVYKSGLLESATDPAERATKYEYDGAGDMTSITDPRGNKYLETEYDANDRVSKQKELGAGAFEFSYTVGSGKVESTTVTEPLGSKRKVTFSSEGLPTSETRGLENAIEQKSTFEREKGTGFLLSSTDARSRKTAYEYDSYGNPISITRLAGTGSAQTYKYAYEPGTTQLTKETDPLGHSTTYEYNSKGERTATTDALGHTTHYEYNGDGQPTVITNPLGKKTTIAYMNGSVASVTDPLGRTSKQFVDPAGRVVAVTAPGGQRTVYEYNGDNQQTKATDPLGGVTSYEYDADGDLTSTSDQLKHKSTFAYTKMDLLESETDALEHKTTAVYDAAGNMTQLTDRRGKVDKFSYDALNRLTESKFGVSGETSESTIKYEYDNGNRLTKIIDSTAGTYTPEYDELNRLKSLATPQGTISYAYDEANRRTSMTVPGQEALKYTYDEANRLKELKRGTQTITFAYDEANRPTNTTLVDGVEEQYGYDEANELTSIAYKKGATTLGELDYAYDLDGRKEAVWGSYARTALPEAFSAAKYNADNEQTERGTKKFSYDANGNLTSDGTSEYKWNARNQLTSITGTIKVTYGYDPYGRRTTRTLGSTTNELLYDGPNVVQEVHEKTVTANLLTGFLPNKVFTRTTSTATESLLADQLGSTIGLAGSTGTVATTYTYDPFGTTTREGTTSENTTQYAGQENDGNNIYYDRARYYNPTAARFISQDPTGQQGSGPNLYLYTNDNPTNATDPYGTTSSPGTSGGGGGGAGAGGSGGSGGGFGPGPGSCNGSSTSGAGAKGTGLSGGGNWVNPLECAFEEGLTEQAEEIHKHHCMPGEVVVNHQCTSAPNEPPPPPEPPQEVPVEEEPPLFPFWPVPIPVPLPMPD